MDDLKEVVETVDFFEESLIVSDVLVQEVMGEDIGE